MSSSNNTLHMPLAYDGPFSITVDSKATIIEAVVGPSITTKTCRLSGDIREITGGFIIRSFNENGTIKSIHVLLHKNVKSIKDSYGKSLLASKPKQLKKPFA